MNDLVLNKKTHMLLSLAEKNTSHAYLFTGKDGLGKTMAAKKFAELLIGPNSSDGDKQRWILFAEPAEGKKLSIEQIKKIKQFCNRSVTQNLPSKVVIIDKAENMSIEASNSLLTLLEDPPNKTVLILVANSILHMPKTIISRLQIINFYPPSEDQIDYLLGKNTLKGEIREYIAKSPAKIKLYLEDNKSIENLLNTAKKFMEGGLLDRMMIVSTLKDKSAAGDLLLAISHIMKSDYTSVGWLQNSESLILAQSHLYNNGNYKLVIENLSLEFR